MEAKRKRNNIIAGVLVLAIGAGMVALPRLMKKEEPQTEDTASILSATAERSSIRTTISGGGTLTDGESTAVTAPHGVEITEFLVKNGDMVEAGQPIATVDMVSVQTALQTMQKNLDYLARQMKLNPGRSGGSTLKAVNAGRVKKVYAKLNDRVLDVIAEHGALAVISLDGLMAVRTKTDSDILPAQNVTVRLPDGKEMPGRVERRLENTITVTLSDNGPVLGDTAEIYNAAGELIGSGELYVHSAWNVTAPEGTVTGIHIKEGVVANANSVIFTLTDVELASDYSKYYEQHLEYEEAMLRLFEISRTGTINADRAGRISGIKDSNIGPVREGGEEYTLVLLNNVPDPPDPRKDPPKNFINRFAQVAQVRFGTMVVYLQKDKASVGRYDTAGNVALSKCKATKIHSFDGVKIYDFNKQKKTWDEIGPDALTEGDILWFVYDADGVLRWVMRPVQPQPVVSGGGGGAYVEPPFEMFELYETDIAEITPQETVTVEVSIDELDIVAVSEGQSAEITIDALPGRTYTGTVSRIDPNGKNTGGNTRYKVTITIKRDENMLTGMNATAILTVGVTENVITIPTAALSQRGTRTVVYTAYDPQTRTLSGEREVSIGVSDGKTVEITEGLSEGEQVWYTYYETSALPEFYPSGAVETA